jgi:hypothetical protein
MIVTQTKGNALGLFLLLWLDPDLSKQSEPFTH